MYVCARACVLVCVCLFGVLFMHIKRNFILFLAHNKKRKPDCWLTRLLTVDDVYINSVSEAICYYVVLYLEFDLQK